MGRFRAVSLFSNCGAGDLGYRSAGFQFEVMAEIDDRRLEVCLLNHPGAVGVSGDLRETWPYVVQEYRRRAGDRRPALLCACPPCQGMSSARSGKGLHADADAGSRDHRNLLVTVIGNVALQLKPAIIVVENVLAFLTRRVRNPEDGEPISAAVLLISTLSDEYVVFPFAADLSDYGLPQSRNRAFLTFVRRDVRGLRRLIRLSRGPYPRPIHGQERVRKIPMSLDEALSSFGLPDLDASSPESAAAEGFGGLHAVPVWDERTYAMVAAIPPGSGRSAWQNDECRRCGVVPVSLSDATCPRCGDPLLRPVVREADGSVRLVKGFKTSYRRMVGSRPASTITTASGHLGSDNTIHPYQTRLLSTLECALLQTFPREFVWGNALRKWGHTNVREMIGEAVPPAFTRLHAEALIGVLRDRWTCAPVALSDDRVARASRKLLQAANEDGAWHLLLPSRCANGGGRTHPRDPRRRGEGTRPHG